MEDRVSSLEIAFVELPATDEDLIEQFVDAVVKNRKHPRFCLRGSLLQLVRSVRLDERRRTAVASAVVHKRLRSGQHGSRPL